MTAAALLQSAFVAEGRPITTPSKAEPNWQAEDCEPQPAPPEADIDPWELTLLPSPSLSFAASAPSVAPETGGEGGNPIDIASCSPAAFDPGAIDAALQVEAEVVDPWAPIHRHPPPKREPADLPLPPATAEPDAERSRAAPDSPVAPPPRSWAHAVVARLAPAAEAERARLEGAFQAVFAERTDERLFREVRTLAGRGVSAEALLAGIALRQAWRTRPGLWLYRTSSRPAPAAGHPGFRALTWAKALQIASRREGHAPAAMIADEWRDDWFRLKARDPGYWRFADYAVVRSGGSVGHRSARNADRGRRPDG